MCSTVVFLLLFSEVTLGLYFPSNPNELVPQLSLLSPACDGAAELKIGKCSEELVSLGVFTQNSSLTINEMRTKSQKHLIMLCTAYRRYNECLGGTFIKQACYAMEPLKSRYAVADATMDFICGEGYDNMLQSWECFMSVSNSVEISMCEKSFGHVSSRQEQMYSEYHPGSAACFAIQTYVDCIRSSIELSCGVAAFHSVVKAIERPVQVYLPYCTLSGAFGGPSATLMFLILYLVLSD